MVLTVGSFRSVRMFSIWIEQIGIIFAVVAVCRSAYSDDSSVDRVERTVAGRMVRTGRQRIERRFAPKSPLVLCGKRTKKTQSIENRYSALVRVTRFELAASWTPFSYSVFPMVVHGCTWKAGKSCSFNDFLASQEKCPENLRFEKITKNEKLLEMC